MATLVCLHAHPDDESIATGGTMMKAKADGHRVVLVLATRGEHGEPVDGVLQPGEQLGIRRIGETMASAAVLGVDRVEFLGYVDSGMMGTENNDFAYSFWQADVEQAAARLAVILTEESADVLTIYDEIGGYGHPDHIQVHRVGARAAQMAGVTEVFEATINRDNIIRSIRANADMMSAGELSEFGDLDDPKVEFGMPEGRITHAVDVTEFCDAKRSSMRCHASQISETDFFLSMPDEAFVMGFGTEWFIEHGKTREPDADFIDRVI